MADEKCENCGATIGRLETPNVWNGHVVCPACAAKLGPKRDPEPARMQRGMKIIIWLLIPISVVFIILILKEAGGGLSYMADAPKRQREADRKKCESNMQILGVTLLNYATDDPSHHFPPTLLSIRDLPLEWTKCPVTGKPYAYVGGGLAKDAINIPVLVYETEAHEGGINLLYADGHVEWEPEESATAMIAKIKAGTNPPPYNVAP